jgi:hypothetical protein
MTLHQRRAWFETRPGFVGTLLTMMEAFDGIKEDRH